MALDFAAFDETWRRIRCNRGYKGFECYSCGRHFKDGEKISVIFTNKGNKTVCNKCGTEIIGQLEQGGNK